MTIAIEAIEQTETPQPPSRRAELKAVLLSKGESLAPLMSVRQKKRLRKERHKTQTVILPADERPVVEYAVTHQPAHVSAHKPRPQYATTQANMRSAGTRPVSSHVRLSASQFDKALKSTKLSGRQHKDIDILYSPLVNDSEYAWKPISLTAILAASPGLRDIYVPDETVEDIVDSQLAFENLSNAPCLYKQVNVTDAF